VILEVSEGHMLEELQGFTNMLKARGPNVTELIAPGPVALFEACRDKHYDAIVVSISAPYRFGTNVTRFHGTVARNLMKGWMNMGVPTVFINHDNVNFQNEYRQLDCVIQTHGCHPESLSVLETLLFNA
jgi:hypothetical protein